MKVYISGKITGDELRARARFDEATQKMKTAGFEVVNPFHLNHCHAKKWEDYMRTDIKALMDCDAIFMLKDWKRSRGARIERFLAISFDLVILEE